MAYNNFSYLANGQYTPYGYGGYNGYQQNLMQYQNQNSPHPNERAFQDVRFTTEQEAKGFLLNPNTNVLLIDRENRIAHIKSADGFGQSSEVLYKFEQINDNENAKLQAPIDTSDFIKKDELKDLVTKKDLENFITKDSLNSLKEEINKLQKQVRINEIWESDKKYDK